MLILFENFHIKKNYIFTLFFSLCFFFGNVALANEYGCKNINFIESEKIFLNIPKKIIIKVDNYRNWQINNQRIILDIAKKRSQSSKFTDAYIDPKFKRKRFNAKINVIYRNNLNCIFKGAIKQHGDFDDHIQLSGNDVLQSINVHLRNGNIGGITKFILYSPRSTRTSDEIFGSNILNEFGYMVPRTFYVETEINGQKNTLMFQEKMTKELLEYYKKREGPIYKTNEDIVLEENKKKFLPGGILAKQININWAKKSQNHLKISKEGISKINFFLLENNQINKNIQNEEINLNNEYLAFGDPEQKNKMNVFNLILLAMNGHHALYDNNRRFYWNSIKKIFEPIYYDGDINILGDFDLKYLENIYIPKKKEFLESLKVTQEKLKLINIQNFNLKLKQQGFEQDIKITEDKFLKIQENLQVLKYYLLDKNSSMKEDNKKKSLYQNLVKKTDSLKHLNYKELKFFFEAQDISNTYLISCLVKNKEKFSCKKEDQKDKFSYDYLEGKFSQNKNHYYLGIFTIENLDIEKIKPYNFKSLIREELYVLGDTKIYYDKGIQFYHDILNKTVKIKQTNPESRVLFDGGKIDNYSIIFSGIKSSKVENLKLPFDINGLTGCLNFINTNFENVKINVFKSDCEDGLNIINGKGDLEKVEIQDTLFDAIDLDFSDIKINELVVNNSGNDCADFSFGNYFILNSELDSCDDKAVSVGEKSNLKIVNLNVKNSDIGVASKDGSKVLLDKIFLINVKTCLAAYNKKQEFYGGFINLNSFNCKNYYKKTEVDGLSEIKLKNKFME